MDNQASFATENTGNVPEDALSSLIWTSKRAESTESVFASDNRISITHTDNISWDKVTNEFDVSLISGNLNSPMGGVSFNMVPQTENEKQTVVSLELRYSVKFPTEFLWNLGGHLPGLFGTYVSSAGTSAAANDVFECRCRWDAKGKLGVNVRKNSEYDPNEWVISAQTKKSLIRDTWYDISLVAHIDGSLEVSVDGTPLFQGACHAGFEKLTGVRFCAYSMDTMGIEGSYLKIKNVEILGKFHSDC